MDKYCVGCGVKLQQDNSSLLGYTNNIENDYCIRCFRLMNYGEYLSISADNIDYDKIFNKIENNLVILVIDILNIPKNISYIKEKINNNWILVLNKRDLLPLSVKDDKLKEYFNKLNLGYLDLEIISANKDYNLDNLMHKIYKYQKKKDVYVVGYTNAGKSSLISKMIKNYGNNNSMLTISSLPSTTLDTIKIDINDKLTIIDTPGIVDSGNIINYVDKKLYKKLNSKKEIKPKTFRINKKEALIVNNILRINYVSDNINSLTFYFPNEINAERLSYKSDKLLNLTKRLINIDDHCDLVINGVGFIKIVKKCQIEIFLDPKVEIFVRNNLI